MECAPKLKSIQDGCINCMDSSGYTALMYALHQGHSKVVRTLLNLRADLDIQGRTGQTALMMAIEDSQHNIDAIACAVDAGANLEISDIQGRTALFQAVQNGDKNLVEYLLQSKANPNVYDVHR